MPKHDPRYESFVHEYFYGANKGNAYQCAIEAGFTHYTARHKAPGWVNNSKHSRDKSSNKVIWNMVQAKRKEISYNYGITEQELMDGYIRDANFDPRNLVDENGFCITNLKELDDNTALSLAGFEIKETIAESGDGSEKTVLNRTVKFKFPDKKGNRDSMSKIKGMFIDRKEITGKGGRPIEVDATGIDSEDRAVLKQIAKQMAEAQKK